MSTKTLPRPSQKLATQSAAAKADCVPLKPAARASLKPSAVKPARTRKTVSPPFDLHNGGIDWDMRVANPPPRKMTAVSATVVVVRDRAVPSIAQLIRYAE